MTVKFSIVIIGKELIGPFMDEKKFPTQRQIRNFIFNVFGLSAFIKRNLRLHVRTPFLKPNNQED